MKICFEGASAVGKSTLCASLKEGFTIVPEVNKLFGKDPDNTKLWYFDRQVDRYNTESHGRDIIFDGDIFQPIWYNWSYHYPRGYLPLTDVMHFYLEKILAEKIRFPDVYFIFFTTEENLRIRKALDPSRSRRNFEKHLKLVNTQSKYFGFLMDRFPGLVKFTEYSDLISTRKLVLEGIDLHDRSVSYDSASILFEIETWLLKNLPDD